MQWSLPKFGTIRIKSAFLFFPKEINHVTKWLETATWSQEYFCGHKRTYWRDQGWVEQKEENGFITRIDRIGIKESSFRYKLLPNKPRILAIKASKNKQQRRY